jgi:hypothetical protein
LIIGGTENEETDILCCISNGYLYLFYYVCVCGFLCDICAKKNEIVPKTGQIGCWNMSSTPIDCPGTGQDGDYQMGRSTIVTPSTNDPYTVHGGAGTRFTDNSDGIVTDNLTGLIWLKQANHKHTSGETGLVYWQDALDFCNTLQSGQCGLTDGSSSGDWRLPNINELHSLVDAGESNPALPSGHPFTNVMTYYYWSSTTDESSTYGAWVTYMWDGHVSKYDKDYFSLYVWPVRSDN